MAATRNRFDGSNHELQAALSPFVTHCAWLQYPEKANDKVRPDILVAHKIMLRVLGQLSANLSFSKKSFESVFQGLREEKQFQEISDPEFGEDWVQTMCRRMRMVCRHAAQARLRKPPPKWVLLLDSMGPESQASEMGDSQGPGPESQAPEKVEEEADSQLQDAQLPHTQLPDAQRPDAQTPKDAITVHACCICWQL